MLNFNKQELEWTRLLVEQAVTKADAEKKVILQGIAEKLQKVEDADLPINTTTEDVEECLHHISELEKLVEEYAANADITDLETYDVIKKGMAVNLMRLSTFKDKFVMEREYLETYLKKEFRVKLIEEIMLNTSDVNGKKISFTQADKYVEADERYIALRNQIDAVARIAEGAKTKHYFFSSILGLVTQSVSTAKKERDSIGKYE